MPRNKALLCGVVHWPNCSEEGEAIHNLRDFLGQALRVRDNGRVWQCAGRLGEGLRLSGPRHSRLATRGAMAKVGRESSGARGEGDRGSHVSGHAKIVFITWHTCVVLQKVQEREAGILLRGIIVYVIVITPRPLPNTSYYGSTHSTWLTHSNWLCVAFSNSK